MPSEGSSAGLSSGGNASIEKKATSATDHGLVPEANGGGVATMTGVANGGRGEIGEAQEKVGEEGGGKRVP